jgi:hypothetical protein
MQPARELYNPESASGGMLGAIGAPQQKKQNTGLLNEW